MQTLTIEQLNETLDAAQWPNFTAIEQQSGSMVFALSIKSSLEYFVGHFPQQPVLPGVVQLHWAAELAKLTFGHIGFCATTNIKFVKPIEPNLELVLTLTKGSKKGVIEFYFHHQEQSYSSGKITFSSMASEVK